MMFFNIDELIRESAGIGEALLTRTYTPPCNGRKQRKKTPRVLVLARRKSAKKARRKNRV